MYVLIYTIFIILMNTLHVAIEVILLFRENSFHMFEQEIESHSIFKRKFTYSTRNMYIF